MQGAATKEGFNITFWNREDMKKADGKTITVTPVPGKKGLVAPTVSVSNKNGKEYRGVTISAHVQVEIAGEQMTMEDSPRREPAPSPAPRQEPAGLTEARVREIVREEMAKAANLKDAGLKAEPMQDDGLPF
jgi:hypothetical protein